MKNKTIKSALLSSMILISAVCFIYVNVAATSGNKTCVNEPAVSIENAVVKDSKMPDLKLIKSVIDILGKFTTAK